jgi:hypothetical protein
MTDYSSFFGGILGGLPLQAGVETRQISGENPTGEKGKACLWDPNPADPFLVHSGKSIHLGRGWKVRPFIGVKAGETVTLADIEGPGCINELFLTSDIKEYSALVVRMYWDNEETPSVEVPMGALFAMGHDAHPHMVNSLPVMAGPYRALNAYWQMPFRKHAKITFTNESPNNARILAYRVLYKLHDVPANACYFHAQWRRERTKLEHPEHIILDGVKGRGLYVGTYLAWTTFDYGWWGEGEVKFYIDGDGEFPTMADNGTEDYFGGAWGFSDADGLETVFNTPFLGVALATHRIDIPRRFSLYRWHLLDSIGFKKDFKATVQALAFDNPTQKYRPLSDIIASTAYWYQTEPHAAFPKLPTLAERQAE